MTSVTPRPTSGRIDTADHHDPTWHIHDVADDFKLLDAWRLPVAGARKAPYETAGAGCGPDVS